jgi:hypothetical protein
VRHFSDDPRQTTRTSKSLIMKRARDAGGFSSSCQIDVRALLIGLLRSMRQLRSLAPHKPPVMRSPAAYRRSALVALCLVALQLVTALHFALIPHGFGAGLNGFVHVHGQISGDATASVSAERRELARTDAPAFERDSGSCASDTCPIGFAGHSSVLLASSEATSLLALPVIAQPSVAHVDSSARESVLRLAPKTSPPA